MVIRSQKISPVRCRGLLREPLRVYSAAGAAALPSSAFTFRCSCDFLRAAVFLCRMPRLTFLSRMAKALLSSWLEAA